MSPLHTARMKLSHYLVLLLPTPEAAHITVCDPLALQKASHSLCASSLHWRWSGVKERQITKQDPPHSWESGSPPTRFVTAVSTQISYGSVMTMWYFVGGLRGQEHEIKLVDFLQISSLSNIDWLFLQAIIVRNPKQMFYFCSVFFTGKPFQNMTLTRHDWFGKVCMAHLNLAFMEKCMRVILAN